MPDLAPNPPTLYNSWHLNKPTAKENMKLIAITGTHGTGKTTMSFQLAAEYKRQGANVKVIQEVARTCPFPLNKDMTTETALWIYHEHRRQELEAAKTHEVVICDRTCFDSFVYAEVLSLQVPYHEKRAALRHLDRYHKLFFVFPGDKAPSEDGIRSTDEEFQLALHERFQDYMDSVNGVIFIDSETIFNRENTWELYL